jgi:PAS domain S-box-containing protein
MPVVDSLAAPGVRPVRIAQLRDVAIAAAVVLAYVAAAQIGFRLAVVAEQVTTVWAPTGIAFATLLLGGVRFWPAIWFGAFLANASTAAPLWTAFFIASGNTLEAVVAVWALRRVPGFTTALTRVSDILGFLIVAAVLCTVISPTIGVTTLCAAGVQEWSRFPALWFDWWFGDVLGAVVVAPAILATARHEWTRQEALRAVMFVIGSVIVAQVVFGPLFGARPYPIEYAIFPIVIGAAAAGGVPVSALAVVSASAVAIWHSAQGAGPFAGQDLHDRLILLQVFMGILTVTALLLGAAITERRASERRERDAAARLRESRDVLSLAMRGGAMGAWSRDLSTNDVWWSRELEDIFGVPAGGFNHTEAGFFEFVHPDDRDAVRRVVDDAVAHRTDYVVEFRFKHARGEWRWMEGRGRAVYREDGKPLTLYGIGVDVTDRKRAEMALQEAIAAAEDGQRRLAETNRELARHAHEQQTLLDVLPIGIGIATDPECRQIVVNRAFADTLGVSPGTNASKTASADERPTHFRVLTPDGAEVPDDQLPMQIAAREGIESRDLEFDIVHDDGRTVRLLEYAVPLMDEQGRPRGAIGAFVDLTAAHQARVTLTRSEERYRRIFETAGVSLWEQDFSAIKVALQRVREDGCDDLPAYLTTHPDFVDHCTKLLGIVDVNPATLRMFGAADNRELKASLGRVFGPEARAAFVGALYALARGDRHYEAEAAVQTLDGRHLDVLANIAFPAPDEPHDRVLVSLADITDRKRAEATLRQEVEVRTTLAQVGASLAGELHSEKLIQAVTDASTTLTDAEFGAFFYSVTDEQGESYQLYSLAGASKDSFSRFPHPRATQIFGPTFRGEGIIRLADVTTDPRYAQNPPFLGMPEGHLPVRSYLAVPVVGQGGLVLGGLFFGHSEAGVFTDRHEVFAAGVAGWAAIALDNARLYQEASEANRLKDEFLATLSHELRTPLNAVLGWAHMLREGTMQPSMRQRALESVERNARAQAQLVEDLLDVSRIMVGKLQIKSDPLDLGSIVANAVDTVRAGAAAKRLNLQVQVRRIVVSGDADRLQQVVWNLLSNAVKFTPPGGRIDVEVGETDSHAEIVVRDSGQGIDPSFRPHLFQRFRQMDASQTRQHGGLGLGLSIVRHLVEAHGGTVAAESAGLDQGATFRVRLPLLLVDRPEAQVSTARARPADLALADVRTLIVDDDPDAIELTRYVLESRGALVVSSASAGEALHLVSADAFDVLIADIGLPEQDGLALIRALRSLPGRAPNRSIPAIALTAYAGEHQRNEALAAGFNEHLGKPFDPDQLIEVVSKITSRHR